MGSNTLTAAATLTCPHGATVTATPTEANIKVQGQAPLKSTDSYTISGCPFTIQVGPATVKVPCVSVIWAVPNVMTRGGMIPPLNNKSVGLCIGPLGVQGKVQISNAGQTLVTST